MKWLKLYFKLLDRFFPNLAAKKVHQLMSKPRVRKLRAFEEEILDRSEKEVMLFKSFEIQTYRWGRASDPAVLVVHGWEGQAGNFGGLVDPLLEKGYRVIAYDAPSHGHSSKGKMNMFIIADLVEILAKKYQPKAIISHSFGSVISAMLLKENPSIAVQNWIMVTTPHKYLHYLENMSHFLELSEGTFNKLIKLVEQELDTDIHDMDMAIYCAQLENVASATIIHSKADKIIPIKSARVVHEGFPQSELVELEKLGHYSILWSDQLKAKVGAVLA